MINQFSDEEIRDWIETHDITNMDQAAIGKAMVIELFENSRFDEEAYPGLKQKIIEAIRNN